MPRSFKLLETLGEGAFGSVHLAEVHEDEGFVQRLAVKCLHPHVGEDPEQSKRLRDEARLLGLLHHEHIVRVHGLTRIDGRLAILMEPVVGADLSRVGSTPVPPRAAVEIVAAVADALDAAWETVPPGQDGPLRVVHRDIKPSNVMVTARGAVKVLDFGVARATFEARESDTRSQQFGTAAYMAPERWLDGTSGAPSDVFSLGITLVEIAGGEPVVRPRLAREAFAEDLALAVERLSKVPGLKELAARMVAYDPSARPSARDVVSACRELADSLPGPDLRAWAETWVPGHAKAPLPSSRERIVVEDTSADTLRIDGARPEYSVGPGFTETLSPPRASSPPSPWRPSRRTAVAVAASVVLVWVAWWSAPVASVAPPVEPEVVVPAEPVVLEPTPSPAPDPEVVPIATAPVEPAVALPAPLAPPPAPAPVPAPTPVPAPGPRPAAVPQGTVTFILDPADLPARTEYGALANRKAQALPQGVHQLTIGTGDDAWRCTVLVDGAFPTWRVDGAQRTCVQVH